MQWYIPFYSLYFILTGLHINFANTTLGLARRFESLNSVLKNSYLPGINYYYISIIKFLFKLCFLSNISVDRNKLNQTQEKVKITTVKTATVNTPTLHATLTKLAAESYQSPS